MILSYFSISSRKRKYNIFLFISILFTFSIVEFAVHLNLIRLAYLNPIRP